MKVNYHLSKLLIFLITISCFSIGCEDMQMLDVMDKTAELPEKHLALLSEREDALTPINDSIQWSWHDAVWEKIKGEETPPKPDFGVDWDVDLFEHWFYLYNGFNDGSRLVYDLGDHSFGEFECFVLLPHFCDGLASIEVKWFANNVEVYNSGVINTDVALRIAFDLPPRTRFLKLQVTNAGEDNRCNYFVIGNPRLISVDPALLTPEPVMQLSEGYLSLTSQSAAAMTAINDSKEWYGWNEGFWEKTREQEDSPNPGNFVGWDTDRFEHWFYSHAVSRTVFDLKGQNFVYFECSSLLLKPCGNVASVAFIWFADDVEVYNSGIVRSANGPRMTFDIPAGTKTLTLHVTDGGDSNACDHYIIGDARLFAEKPEPTVIDTYHTLPEILLSPELEPGKYRILPTYIGYSNYKISTFHKIIGDEIADTTEVRIVLNRQPWSETAEGKPVVEDEDALVVEIVGKNRVYDERRGRFTHTYHEYEGVALLNLSRPERLFEYEVIEPPPHLAILTETDEAILPSNDHTQWVGWGDGTWGKTIDGVLSPKPDTLLDNPTVETFDYWFYSHAECRFVYELGAHNYRYFESSVVLVDSGSVEFIWFADDMEVYRSGVLTERDAIQQIGFEIPAGTQTLTLQVTDGGNNINHDHFVVGNPRLLLEKPEVISPEVIPSTVIPHVFIDPAEIRSPTVGHQFTLPIKITNGMAVNSYTINVGFDPTALKYISIENANYLQNAVSIPTVVSEDSIKMSAALWKGFVDGDGTLATITFEVVALKPSDIRLSDVIITSAAGGRLEATTTDAKVVVP